MHVIRQARRVRDKLLQLRVAQVPDEALAVALLVLRPYVLDEYLAAVRFDQL